MREMLWNGGCRWDTWVGGEVQGERTGGEVRRGVGERRERLLVHSGTLRRCFPGTVDKDTKETANVGNRSLFNRGKQLGTREKVPGWSFWPLGRTQLWPSGLYLHTWRGLETSQSRWRMLMSSSRSLWSFNVRRMKATIPLCCVLNENIVGCLKKRK